MGMFPAGAPLALLLALVVGGMIPPCAQTAQAAARQAVVSVYDKQPPVTEKEVLGFVELLPVRLLQNAIIIPVQIVCIRAVAPMVASLMERSNLVTPRAVAK